MVYQWSQRIAMLVLFICAGENLARAALSATFVPIEGSEVNAISSDGGVVAGQTENKPYLWTLSGGVQTIALPPNNSLFAVFDLSADGTTIVGGLNVGAGSSSFYEAFRWRGDVGFQRLGRFPASDPSDWAFATGVSYDGSVVVGINDTNNGRRAFRWTEAAGSVNLGTLRPLASSSFSEATDVSRDGKYVVGYVSTTADAYYKPYRWTESNGYDVIGLPPASPPLSIPAGGADAISGDGLVIAGISQLSGFDNWTWSEQAGFSLLNFEAPENSGRVFNISFDGRTIVGRQITWNQPRPGQTIDDAVIWQRTPAGYQIHRVADLLTSAGIDLSGWHLTETRDVADDGRTIVGLGIAPDGMQRSWYAVISVAEPTAAWIASVFGVALVVLRRTERMPRVAG